MAVRGLELSAEQRATVERCTDLQLLDTWIDRAVKAETIGEVFEH